MYNEKEVDFDMREDIYMLVQAVYEKKEPLDQESQKLLEKTRKNFIDNGVGIPTGPKRERFREIQKRMSNLCVEFSKNLNADSKGIWVTAKELDGLPQDIIQRLEVGTDENEGKLKLTFKYPDLLPGLKFINDSKIRKRLVRESENKVPENIKIFEEVMALRAEAAHLLGFPTWADIGLEDKMAKTSKTVNDFLGDLRSRLSAGGKLEMEHLKEIKHKWLADNHMPAEDDKLYIWDKVFYERIMIGQEFSIDENKIAEYFPITKTIRGMMNNFEKLFGLRFVELDSTARKELSSTGNGDDLIWHEDVRMFSVWNDESLGNGFVGYLYLDLHPRPGKFGHAANFVVEPGYLVDATRRYPSTILICNFSQPGPNKTALLKHGEVVTFFHELGHGIHSLVSKVTYSQFHGTNVARDFIEAPSQMLENWTWEPKQLKALSSHYETGKSIPDDLLASLLKTKHVNSALFNLRQLQIGIFDMACHTPSSPEIAKNRNYGDLYNQLRTEIMWLSDDDQLTVTSNGNGHSCIGHLLGGYDAGYYGYLYSQVYSADMYQTGFAKDPMNEEQGRRYRKMILEKGGSTDEMQMLEEFLGRKPSSDAFYKELGLQ